MGFWQDKTCGHDSFIRCKGGNSGECVWKSYWGIEGGKDGRGRDLTCSDDGDKYRPIKEEGDAGGESSPKVWKTRPVSEYRYNWKYKGKEWGANYTKDESTQLWMIPESDPFKVPAVTEEDFEGGPKLRTSYVKVERKWSNFYSSDDYVKDETTNLMIAPTSEEACKDNDGFVCKVGGVKTCFKRENLCNLHPQCDPVDESNTAEDELGCDNEYRKKRLITRQATYRCQSPYHNEDSLRKKTSRGVVWIRAVLNDGNPECWKEEDEIERSTDWVSYYFPGWSSIFEKSAPFKLKRNALLTTLPSLPREWMVEFEVKPTIFDHDGWSNIFHMTKGGDARTIGDRIPAVFYHPRSGLGIRSHINQEPNYAEQFDSLPIGEWTKIRVSQELIGGKFRYRIFIDEKEETNVENSRAVGFENVKVFASDPWYEAQPGSIKNLKISVKGN